MLKTQIQPPVGKGVDKMANKTPLLEIPLCTAAQEGEEPALPTPFLDAERKGEKIASSLDDEMVKFNFDDDFDILLDCNIVVVLPVEFDKFMRCLRMTKMSQMTWMTRIHYVTMSWIIAWSKRGQLCLENMT